MMTSFLVEFSAEFQAIYQSFRQCVKLRQKYMRLSYQRPGDNPKDLDTYEPYPVPAGVGRIPTSLFFSRSNLSPGDIEDAFIQPLQIDMTRIPGKLEGVVRMGPDGVFEYFADESGLTGACCFIILNSSFISPERCSSKICRAKHQEFFSRHELHLECGVGWSKQEFCLSSTSVFGEQVSAIPVAQRASGNRRVQASAAS